MHRTVVALVALALLAGCGSGPKRSASSSDAGTVTNPDLVAMYLAASRAAQGCGDPSATAGYVPQANHHYLVVAQGDFVCNDVSTPPSTKPPTGTVITVEGSIDRYGRFAGSDFSLTGTAPVGVLALNPPSAGWKPAFRPELIREIVTKQAARCGDAHPTNIRYVVTTMAAADDRAVDYTIAGGKVPIYAVIASGRFTCRHWARTHPVPAVRTVMTLFITADGSGLNVYYEAIDTISHIATTAGALSRLP